ncbi:MAG: aminoacyl-histidine dipeptidase [Prevotellaceae bacterium]|jgi:dipeptidase D|nr:aminoacyl-histidine dipeptidase [Prevotellaceae bacterium]
MKHLEPKALWNYFYEITQIPRPSKKEERITAYLKAFGEKHRLATKVDKSGNVLISKPAAKGYENAKKIILQSHQDMVCEKNKDVEFNFDTDPIQTCIDGDWLKAKGTTLGADNGIGMAISLAILTDDALQHPAMECLFTVDEETGLTGAFALENDFMTGDILINLDSEDDGEIFIGCAGGIDTVAELAYTSEITPQNYFPFEVSVKGLLGGHSGDDIDKNRGNANRILSRFLWNVNKKTCLRLHSFNGGNLRNAIPREACALAAVPASEKENLRVWFNLFVAEIENEISHVEPQLKLSLESASLSGEVIDKHSSDRLINALYSCPNGVIAMSADMPGMVETSTNLAAVRTKSDHIEITTSQRSSVELKKHDIANRVEASFLLAGATVKHGEGYPGWQPNVKSGILKIAQSSYKKLFGEDALVRSIHAGLECGLFLEKYPQLDMISIGPTMRGVHSPDEKLNIPATQKCWDWLVDILKEAK